MTLLNSIFCYLLFKKNVFLCHSWLDNISEQPSQSHLNHVKRKPWILQHQLEYLVSLSLQTNCKTLRQEHDQELA